MDTIMTKNEFEDMVRSSLTSHKTAFNFLCDFMQVVSEDIYNEYSLFDWTEQKFQEMKKFFVANGVLTEKSIDDQWAAAKKQYGNKVSYCWNWTDMNNSIWLENYPNTPTDFLDEVSDWPTTYLLSLWLTKHPEDLDVEELEYILDMDEDTGEIKFDPVWTEEDQDFLFHGIDSWR